MEDELANLHLAGEEEDAFQEDPNETDHHLQFCLLGTCLTNSVVHFQSLQNTMANLWHPIGGIAIINLGEKRYLFKFFYAIDIKRVLDGRLWFFNNHILLLHKLRLPDDPLTINLNYIVFWIQIHDLPPCLMSEQWLDEQDGSRLRFIGFYGNPDERLKGIFSVGWVTINVSIGDCEKVIRDYWEATSNNLPTKLEGLGKKLLVWNSSVQRNRKVHKQKLVDRMKELHDVEQTDDAIVELNEI
ncbi:hypothetical protein Golax_020490 [Gossypium laxum]|uniref:DUF4283 domain-containing protein n=1 Tax=Gossypium laxum TaxID=34288 RepID=A0A7J9B031_9ROSI|nr:hypothetical protein [Gossypium laxum]